MPDVAVVVPCYRETNKILQTLAAIPPLVSRIYCIDDACPDGTGKLVREHCRDSRVTVITHSQNQGVGGAVVTGYQAALSDGMDIVVKIDGDGQMDPELLPTIMRPVAEGRADYAKGNRFFILSDLTRMPKVRIFGNAVLSFLSKFSSGYWQVFDPTNGYTAVHADALRLLPLEKLRQGYFFESDMLFRLSTIRAVVQDVPQRAVYEDEESGISLFKVVPSFTLYHMRNFVSRIFYNYFLRDFHLASLEWLFGPMLILFGLIFGSINWLDAYQEGRQATAGTVMLSALPLLAGLQLLLSAIGFDVDNQPQIPIQGQNLGEAD